MLYIFTVLFLVLLLRICLHEMARVLGFDLFQIHLRYVTLLKSKAELSPN